MADLPLKSTPAGGIKRDEAEGATNAQRPLEHRQLDRSSHMSRCGHYTDSACADNTEQSPNWRSIGELARELAEKARGDA